MKKNKKAFWALELTVFLWISIIFTWIVSISLSSQNIEANNTKVTSDIRSMSSYIEIATSWANPKKLNEIIVWWRIKTNWVDNKLTFGEKNIEINKASKYEVWKLDLKKVWLNEKDYKDPNAWKENTDYLFWIIISPEFRAYQLSGQIIENDIKKARISGTYFNYINNTAKGLLSSAENNKPLENWEIIGWFESNLYKKNEDFVFIFFIRNI